MMIDIFKVEEPIIDHCRAVANLALKMGRVCNRAGAQLNLPLIQASSLLHDLARKQPRHAHKAAFTLNQMGYPDLAEIVAEHMDIDIDETGPLKEKELVYLADKSLHGHRLVCPEKRILQKMAYHASNPKALSAIRKRLSDVIKIKSRLEKMVNMPLEELLGAYGGGFQQDQLIFNDKRIRTDKCRKNAWMAD